MCADMRIQQEKIPEDITFPHIKCEPDENRTHSVHIVQGSSGESHVTSSDVACNSQNTYSSNSILLKLHAITHVLHTSHQTNLATPTFIVATLMYKKLKECHPRCVYQIYNRLIINNDSQKHNYINYNIVVFLTVIVDY